MAPPSEQQGIPVEAFGADPDSTTPPTALGAGLPGTGLPPLPPAPVTLPANPMDRRPSGLSPDSTRLLQRTISIGSQKTLKVTFAAPTPMSPLMGSSPPQDTRMAAVGKAWQRKVLQDLQDETHFSSTELQMLLHHFTQHQSSDDHLDRSTFFKSLSNAFGSTEEELLAHIYTAMDDTDAGYLTFRQFVCALSTVFRGDAGDILAFWFRMYDSDHDGFLSKQDFELLLKDVNTSVRKDLLVVVEQIFTIEDEEGVVNVSDGGAVMGRLDEEEDGYGQDNAGDVLLSFEEFRGIMEEHDVIPIFVNPHKFAQHKQAPSFRTLTPAEREVILLLGTEVRPAEGEVLIEENEKCIHFYFIMEGEVAQERGGVLLGTVAEGNFLGEAALFADVKSTDDQGNVRFTTAARVLSPDARLLKMDISCFYPLVYHEHPGATAIVQRLGRVMLERFQQTEDRLQAILASQARQSEAGMRLSSADWAAFRKRLTKQWALKYHKIGRKGKLEVVPTKLMGTKEDLSVAYSPGVAEPCLSIQQNEKFAYEYTAKGHLVGVLTNGTAVLGLGNIGALAGKPVMEGKAVLFKKFADLDSFDIEIDEQDPEKLVNIVCALEPTFGGINLEDIKAPECFYVERECQRRCSIPVFHDDQHGTAIIAGAGLLNALTLVDKDIGDIRVVVCGCGAAGYTCATYFITLGVKKENLLAVDLKGVVYAGREDLTADNYLSNVAVETDKRTLKEALVGADVFLGLSAGGLLTPEMLLTMGRDPIVFACANPMPEIDPDLALATRSDVIMATGRSDFPNQINNVCAFPYIFRGALDCRARAVNEEMKLAATNAIAALAKRPPTKRRVPSIGDLNLLPMGALSASHANGSAIALDANAPSSSGADGSTAGSSEAQGEGSVHGSVNSSVSSGAAHHNGRAAASLRHPSPSRLRRRSAHSCETINIEATKVAVFGRDHIIPKPFDERLLPEVASAVVQAAIDSGVARLTDIDMVEYKRMLIDLSHRTSM